MNKKIVINKEKIAEMQEYYNSGKTVIDCAKEFGFGKDVVSRSIIKNKRIKRTKEDELSRGYKSVISWIKRVKVKLVEHRGGKCILCGYNKCNSSLHFHHIDPNTKEFEVTERIRSFEKMKKESDKCVILCANCHGEVHAGISSISGGSLNG
jgi:hypothetical protein